MDSDIEKALRGIDLTKLREEHKELIEQLGSCPLSCSDIIEGMEERDAMCLAIDIGRSEACINDPTRLIIKDIIPTFMGADSFLDSAAFHLKRDMDSHGGMTQQNEGHLAEGIGRESITGCMPLYLFKEHWDIAKRKMPSLMGFMCTADIMGFASNQTYTIPFLVFNAALKKRAQ